jgi:hypothetical protein
MQLVRCTKIHKNIITNNSFDKVPVMCVIRVFRINSERNLKGDQLDFLIPLIGPVEENN